MVFELENKSTEREIICCNDSKVRSVMTYRRRNIKKRRRNKSSPQTTSESKKHRQSEVVSPVPALPSLAKTDLNTESDTESTVFEPALSEIKSETDIETNSLESVDKYFEEIDNSNTNMANTSSVGDLGPEPSQMSQSILTGDNGAQHFMNSEPSFVPPHGVQQQSINSHNLGDQGYMSPHATQPHPMNFAPQMQHMVNMSPHMQHMQTPPPQSLPPPMYMPQGLSDEDICRIAEKMKQLLSKEINILVEKTVAVKVAPLQTEITNLKTSLAKVQKDLKDVTVRNDDLEQYSRRSCLRISGIPEQGIDDTTKAVLDLADKCGVNVRVEDIDRSHRVGKPKTIETDDGEDFGSISDEPQPQPQAPTQSREIIVKFRSSDARLELLKARKFCRERKLKIYINEDLTKTRKNLAFACRKLKKDAKSTVAKTWVYNGNVFIQDNDDNKVRVTTMEDLDPYIPKPDDH